MTVVDSTIETMQGVQSVLSALTALAITDCHFPMSTDVTDGDTFDFIVIGSGAGGSVISSRLSESSNISVLLVEAGGIPPLESVFTGLFPAMTLSSYDWNCTAEKSSYANQYLQKKYVEMTSGITLGGCSSLDHSIYVPPNRYDFARLAAAANDSSYNYENMLPFMRMIETFCDEKILDKYPEFHGTHGPLMVTRELSDKNINILAAFNETGHDLIDEVNGNVTLGYCEPTFLIGEVWRQSAAETYLRRAKNRTNLIVQMNAMVTKILINSSNIATGVVIQTSDGINKTINARKEVILSAGAIKSPQLLMVSGIGNKTLLEKIGINVIVDLPVGRIRDHPSVLVAQTLETSNETSVIDLTKFPADMTTGYVSLDGQNVTYQAINMIFPHDSTALDELCVSVFKYNNSICGPLHTANVGKDVLVTVIDILYPESIGTVEIESEDATLCPKVDLGHLSNPVDLKIFVESIVNFIDVGSSTYFKSIDSEIVKMDLYECMDYEFNTTDYWQCYVQCLSSTMWHYSSTCPIGDVLNSNMTVKGVDNLRVIDGSTLPNTLGGNIIQAVYILAEKGARSIKARWNLS